MERDINDSVVHTPNSKESESDKSFVGKVKSIINSTPLSKWFGKQEDNKSVIRKHEEVFDDEDSSAIQPPSKKAKLPINEQRNSCSRSSIHFNENCIPATNSVPSNIFSKVPEPVAGPSGIKSQKLLSGASTSTSTRHTFNNNELLNGHSDSEESTSGYSSVARIGSKEQVCESQESSKQASPTQTSPSNTRSLFHKSCSSSNRSLFAERSLIPNMNTSLSSRRPTFNASTFGSPNFVDKTISTKRIIDSPFYNGKTIYGGASAYGRALGRSSQDLRSSLRNSVQIKPVNKTTENRSLVLGKTARRILDTIEQYSSPINDAKKIPIVSKKARQDGLLTKYIGANPYRLRETKIASNKELQVPTVPDLLKMKMRLQESTEAVKKIANSSKSDLNTEYYKLPTKESDKEKHTGKIKTKVTSVRQKQPHNETVGQVDLPPVSLPITSLPKFDFVLTPPSSTKDSSESRSQTCKTTKQPPASKLFNTQSSPKTVQSITTVQKETRTTTTTSVTEYKFSNPLVIANNVKSVVAINDFKFSDPHMCTKNKSDTAFNFKMPENKLPNLLPTKNVNRDKSPVKTANELKSGSVMDVLGKKSSGKNDSLLDKFKPVEGTWECSVCLIRNQPDKTKCAACESPRTGSVSLLDKFKPVEGTWECSVCLIRNQPDKMKCAACESPRTGSVSLLDKFKPVEGTWECSVCLIRNQPDKTKCAACESPKTGSAKQTETSFGSQFKLSSDKWECSSCMVYNRKEATKCVACETPKPNPTSGIPPLNFGSKKPASNQGAQSGFGNAFKVKSDEWECGTCMVRNKAANTKCQCCETPNPKSVSSNAPPAALSNDTKPIASFNFGIDKAAATTFTFGIPVTAPDALPKTETQAASIFGKNPNPVSTTTGSFTFGVPTTTQNSSKIAEASPVETPKTSVTSTTVLTSNPLVNVKETEKKAENAQQTLFKFGVKTPSTTISDNKSVDTIKSISSTPSSTSNNNKSATFNFKPTTINGEVVLFGNNNKQDKVTPAITSPAAFTFGSKTAAVAATAEPSLAATTKPLFNFASSTENTSAASTNLVTPSLNNGFVSSTSTPSFGAGFQKPVSNSTEIKPFTFNSTVKDSTEPASKVSMFSFGQSATGASTNATKSSGFNFNSSAPAPTFQFTGGKTENNVFNTTPANNNIFGASTTNANAQNGMFNFGNMASNNSNQKAGFSFGAAVNNVVASGAQPTNTGFNFGAAAATFTPPTGGFNFSAAAKPTFNFTDGSVAAFTAQPAADASNPMPRKIKRAVRRTQR
ncbi:hypothetical protein NQ315_000816 [Exocentrus adspersus]|uniref:Nuclear pore complex protein Nup153 n=1 Tax=Exocentrus adspersus TaxID=1586481 RepID=A0AAV8WF07_9CUCU|nr:hypothetical protein NQ315_000816 [Exocentrus adspersus]